MSDLVDEIGWVTPAIPDRYRFKFVVQVPQWAKSDLVDASMSNLIDIDRLGVPGIFYTDIGLEMSWNPY